MATVRLIDLTKEYLIGKPPAVANLNLTIEDGELMVLLGPSGCGKTTVLRLIAGLIQPTRGDLHFNGESVLCLPPERRGAPMVFQQHALFPFMTVGDNIAFGLRIRRMNRSEIRHRVGQALAAVQLAGYEEQWPDQLSGGQSQRVALARVLAVEPRLLLLDEPLNSLDQGLREEVRDVIRRLQRLEGVTTLFVTHDRAEAMALADRIALLFEGQLHQVGSPRAFYEGPRDTRVAHFFGGVNFFLGIKQGALVQTPVGPLVVNDSTWPDGEVVVTIRPEAIEIGANGHNTVSGFVRTYSYFGSEARCCAEVNGVLLEVVAPPFITFGLDEAISLHLPPERLCLLSSKQVVNPSAKAISLFA